LHANGIEKIKINMSKYIASGFSLGHTDWDTARKGREAEVANQRPLSNPNSEPLIAHSHKTTIVA
jgi:hypothetical protein